MTEIVKMKGLKFHYLKVLAYWGGNNHREAMWECLCKCGKRTAVRGSDLRNGHTKSCGCWNPIAQKRKWEDYRQLNNTKMNARYKKRVH